jgi:hypothetical protein
MKNYLLFKLELELMGFDTFGKDNKVKDLYKKYMENRNDYRKEIGRSIEVSCRNRRTKC